MFNNKLTEIKIILSSNSNWDKDLVKKISLKKLKFYIENDYSVAHSKFLNDIILYRGDNGLLYKNSYLIKPSERFKGKEKTVYTTLFSEILPSWSDWPRRDHCIICSTDFKYADVFGNVFIVYPKNNTKIGICTKKDLFDSFENFNCIADLDEFFFRICRFMDKNINTREKAYKTKFNSKDNLMKFFEDFKIFLKNEDNIKNMCVELEYFLETENLENFFKLLNLNKNNIIKFLNQYLNPFYNGFMLLNIENFKKETSPKEIWFDSEALLIPYTFKEQLKSI